MGEKMQLFIEQFMGVTGEEAFALRERFGKDYGTTRAGGNHKIASSRLPSLA